MGVDRVSREWNGLSWSEGKVREEGEGGRRETVGYRAREVGRSSLVTGLVLHQATQICTSNLAPWGDCHETQGQGIISPYSMLHSIHLLPCAGSSAGQSAYRFQSRLGLG